MSTFNVPEAAAYLKVHPQTVLDLINDCVIAAAKPGRSYVIRQSELDKYLDHLTVKQTAERMKRRSGATRGI